MWLALDGNLPQVQRVATELTYFGWALPCRQRTICVLVIMYFAFWNVMLHKTSSYSGFDSGYYE